jgi:hypothetical protein
MKALWLSLVCVMLTACASLNMRLQEAGPVAVGNVQVSPQEPWNILPESMTPFARPKTQVWTRDGVLLDRLMIIPGVPEGEPLFKEPSKEVALPRFKRDMLPDEIVQLTESSMTKLLGEGTTLVRSSNLRPGRFGEKPGIIFDLVATPSEGPVYRGLAGAFVAAEQLNMIIFVAAEPYYFDKHRAAAEGIIASAH